LKSIETDLTCFGIVDTQVWTRKALTWPQLYIRWHLELSGRVHIQVQVLSGNSHLIQMVNNKID
jgi:hypothetical protein